MAEETTTGAVKEVAVDKEAMADRKKKIIKYVVIAAVLILAYFLIRKYVLR